MRKTLRLTAVALGLAAAGAVMAQGYGPGGGYGPGMMGGGYGPGMMGYGPLSALDLKDDQRATRSSPSRKRPAARTSER